MIVLAARPCWANSSRLRRKSCLSSGPCTHVSPHTSGGMTRAIATRSSKPKGSSKAILLRRRYSRLACTMRSQPRRDSWRQENSWQPSWMTFMSSRRRHEPVACWTPSPTPSSSRPGWQQTSAKRVSIMQYHAQSGPAPPGIRELGEDVWRGDKPPAERGFVALGVPIGHHEFIRSCANARLEEERRLLTQLPQLPDLQCAWLLLLFCAAPRAQHLLRTVPPAIVAYVRDHDEEVWRTLQDMLGGHTADAEQSQRQARDIAFLPASLGGLGLMHAERLSPAAYWAAWADALPVLQQRCPEAAARCLQELRSGNQAAAPSLQAAAAAGEDPATTLAPDLMHLALRRRMRLPLPITRARCGGDGTPGCRALVDNLGDHAMACPRTGLLARRGFVLERAWIQVDPGCPGGDRA